VNQANLKLLAQYVLTIEKELVAGNATEHTHRPALKALIENLASGLIATNEPKHIECGAPDFVVRKDSVTIGYIEAKDIGKSLDEVEKTDQLKRYRDSLTNLVLTDYLEFRWYVDGDKRLAASLGTITKEGKIKRDKAGIQAVGELLGGFITHKAEAVGTPKELALRMARLAHMIRNLIVAAFEKEAKGGGLHTQLSAFRDNLIPDLSVDQFADMYSQTIAYGLFASRCTTTTGKDFTRQNAAYLLPKTNPFLRKLFNHIAGPDLDDRIAWLVDDLAQVLAQADMASVLKDFGKHTAKEDAVVHFYETFLTAYDSRVREMRGVYYTPEPVVSYIVRSIDYLLKTRFNRPQGLTDANTLILDPAVGTATFLYMVITEIHNEMVKQGQKGLWNDYVANKLLPRIFGFELLMAPYAVAHLKLGLLLKETGYQFKTDQRLGIYLTNTLEEAFKKSEQLAGFNEYIVEEANEAAEIKKEKPIMVVLGNPPYSGVSANRSEIEVELHPGDKYIDHLKLSMADDKKAFWWPVEKQVTDTVKKRLKTFIGRLIEDYKIVDNQLLDEKNPKWLQDDYVKFIRFGQWRVDRTRQGVLGFITNHSYLDNPTFRGMRQSLMNTFTDIYILNLHGNAKKKEVAPDGSKDENVFDIQQGVAIAIFVKELGKTNPAKVYYADLWGLRDAKYHALLESDIAGTDWAELKPTRPFYLFVPLNVELLTEYEKGWKITEIFPINSVGIVTSRDHFVMDFDSSKLRERITSFRETNLSDEEVKERFGLEDKQGWNVTDARKSVRQDPAWDKSFTECLYRPFDIRHIFYHKAVIERTRPEVMHHMLSKENLALHLCRQVVIGRWQHLLATDHITDDCYVSNITRERGYTVPLYIYPTEKKTHLDKSGGKESGIQDVMTLQAKREPNLKPEFIKNASEKLGLKFIEDGKGDLNETFGPEDIFNYAYAVLHLPTYRSRYVEFLKIDFPRLPLTSDKELFKKLVEKGAELVSLHLMESPVLNNFVTKYPIPGSNMLEKVNYDENTHRVYINKTQYFEGIPAEVWNFYIGGYQVCHKWLKDRKGRTLSYDELTHYQKVVVALKETNWIMAEIDALIPGWPIE
jgi:predicted helicase